MYMYGMNIIYTLTAVLPAQFAEFLAHDYNQIVVKFTNPPESVLVRLYKCVHLLFPVTINLLLNVPI